MSLATENTELTASGRQGSDTSYVDWPAIFAGAVVASAISIVLLTFGSALGLSFASPFENTGMSAMGLAIALALWLVWVQVSSFMAGGYISGRMRRRVFDATEHESDVRDGFHGLAVWGVGVVIGGVLLAMGATGALNIAANTAGQTVQAATEAATDGDNNLVDYAVGTAFRSDRAADQGTEAAVSDTTTVVTRAMADGEMTADDRAYLASVIARQTGVSPEEAQARVDALAARAQEIADEAAQAAERARIFSVIAAFIAAASLAVSAAGAYWAAGWGGRHRDEGTVIPMWFDRIR